MGSVCVCKIRKAKLFVSARKFTGKISSMLFVGRKFCVSKGNEQTSSSSNNNNSNEININIRVLHQRYIYKRKHGWGLLNKQQQQQQKKNETAATHLCH